MQKLRIKGLNLPTQISLMAMIVITVFVLAFAVLGVSQRLWIDDAFISFRYARNLRDGQGLVFNIGQRVEGYTNFLWIMFAYLGLLLQLRPIFVAQALSVVSQLSTLWFLYLLGSPRARPSYQALVAPLFLAFQVSFLAYSMTGMETTFFTMLVTLAALLYKSECYMSRKGSVLAGIVLLAICLTRFDGFVLAFLFVGYQMAIGRKFKHLPWLAAVLLSGLAVYNIWRLSYYPTPLPNTFYAKASFSSELFREGLRYIWRFFRPIGQYVLPLALLSLVKNGVNETNKLAAWVIAGYLAYVVAVGGDWMMHSRFVLPVLPLILLLMQEGVWTIYEPLAEQNWSRKVIAICSLLILFGFNLVPLKDSIFFDNGELQFFAEAAVDFFRREDAAAIGTYLDQALPSDYVVASEFAGIMAFPMRQNVLDTFGLVDGDIPRHNFPSSAFGRTITADYLAKRAPDIVVPCNRIFVSVEDALHSTQAGGCCRSWMQLVNVQYGYKVCIMKIREDAYWPALTRAGLPEQKSLCVDVGMIAD